MSDEDPVSDKKGSGREPHFVVVDRRPTFSDDGAVVQSEARHPTVVEQLKVRAEEAEQRAREISTAYRKIEEEREAFRQRLGRGLERRIEMARAEMMRKVITVLDDLDRAIAAARAAADPDAFAAGVALIRDRLFQVLASEGVEPIETVGRPFDPSLAEAVAAEETDDPARDNLVLREVEKGYTLGGTLLRAARVKVARLTRHQPEEAAPEPSPVAPESASPEPESPPAG